MNKYLKIALYFFCCTFLLTGLLAYSSAADETACFRRYLTSTGQCNTGTDCSSLGSDWQPDNGADLCPGGQVCCHKVASTSGAASVLEMQVPLFDYAQAANLPEYILTIYKYAVIIIVPLAIIMIIIGGIFWISAAGNQGKITKAKGYIIDSFIGLGLALFSYIFLSLIGIQTLTMPGLENIKRLEGDALFINETDLGNSTPPAGMDPADFKTSQGSNPFKFICDQYPGGKYSEAVALKCKALGSGPPPGADFVKTPDGYLMDRKYNTAFNNALACMKQKNPNAYIHINCPECAYRSPAAQYEMWYIKLRNDRGVAAKPCCSNHGGGIAADISSNQPLAECMNKYGISNKVSGEAWHWSFGGL